MRRTMLEDLVGFDNGYVKVLSYKGLIKNKNGKSRRSWNCECKCLKSIILTTSQIYMKTPKGCCFKQSRPGNKINHLYLLKHGLNRRNKRHPVYRMWLNIKYRCFKAKTASDIKNYLGKGIYEPWINDSKAFIDWVFTNGWLAGLTIDRIDPNKGYYPGNIQFLTLSENSKKVFKDNPALNKGVNHRDAKITEEQVKEIKKLIEQGLGNTEIAKQYPIKPNVVYQIRTGKTWKHII